MDLLDRGLLQVLQVPGVELEPQHPYALTPSFSRTVAAFLSHWRPSRGMRQGLRSSTRWGRSVRSSAVTRVCSAATCRRAGSHRPARCFGSGTNEAD